jgi:hypothetical protein
VDFKQISLINYYDEGKEASDCLSLSLCLSKADTDVRKAKCSCFSDKYHLSLSGSYSVVLVDGRVNMINELSRIGNRQLPDKVMILTGSVPSFYCFVTLTQVLLWFPSLKIFAFHTNGIPLKHTKFRKRKLGDIPAVDTEELLVHLALDIKAQ